MKNHLYNIALLTFLTFYGCGNQKTKQWQPEKIVANKNLKVDTTSVIQKNVLINDTFYLYKRDFPNWDTPYYEHIYRSKDSLQYQSLIPNVHHENFSLTNHPYPNPEWINQRYKIETGEIPKKWTELIYYGNQFYLKYPSDFCSLNQKTITDSCLISRSCEGPYLEKITNINKLNNSQYEISLGFDRDKPSKTIITIIDQERGISIWQTENKKYKLYADIEKYKKIPIAKTDCNGNKCGNELESKDLDYLKLINNAM